jgi:excisionase family DNA binding protein
VGEAPTTANRSFSFSGQHSFRRLRAMADELVTEPERRPVERAVYDFAEVCTLFGIPRSTAQELLKRGELPVKPIRIGGKWRFPKAAVDRLLGLDGV